MISNCDAARRNGGPAFPQNTKIVAAAGQELHQGFSGGMTLRDYFAAKALNFTLKNCFTTEGAVERSYEIADAMMEARK